MRYPCTLTRIAKTEIRTIAGTNEGGEMGSLMPYWWPAQMESNTKLNMYLPHQSVLQSLASTGGKKNIYIKSCVLQLLWKMVAKG